MALFVYKKVNGSYQQAMAVHAPTLGYHPGAWFLDESPRKAIFETRACGSSGDGLFYFDWKRRRPEPITDGFCMEDIDKESAPAIIRIGGTWAIFVTARGRDRTASQGGALLGWNDETYQLWWPKCARRAVNPAPVIQTFRLSPIAKHFRRSFFAIVVNLPWWY